MKKQRGLSLVELMVATSIGLLLVLGLGQVFLSLKQTFTLRQKMSVVQNAQRMAMMFLETSIYSAGYYPNPGASGSVAPTPSVSGAGTDSGADTLTVKFVAENRAGITASQGCSAILNPGDTYTDVFSVSGGYLTCTEIDAGPTANTTSTVSLMGGLTAMSILYGVDTTGNGSASQYFSAATMPGWNSVKTINITLQFANPLSGQPGQPATVSLTETIPNITGL